MHRVLREEAEAQRADGVETVQITLAEGHERYATAASYHEAGFDAYITGCVLMFVKGFRFFELQELGGNPST